MAVYGAAMMYAPSGHVEQLPSGSFRVEVHAGSRTTVTAAFSEVADRVGALGGRFMLSSTPEDETVVTAVIPCAS